MSVVKDIEMMDRLSELPDEVLIHILPFLPMLDSVRTMLIRRFGNLWKLVPKLDFDIDCFCQPSNVGRNKRFCKFVTHVLRLHQASVIDSFRLDGWQGYENAVNVTHEWIRCAMRKNPKVVHVCIEGFEYFPLPYVLFDNQSVVELSLKRCEWDYERQVYNASLRSLCLDYLLLDSDSFIEMICGFPSLEKLELIDCPMENRTLLNASITELKFVLPHNVDVFCQKIDYPNVKILNLGGPLGCFETIDLKSVRNASIILYSTKDRYEQRVGKTTEFLKKPANVEILKFNALALKFAIMEGHEISQELSTPCLAPNLRKVHIYSKLEHDHQVHLQLVQFVLKCGVVLDEVLIFSKAMNQLTSTMKQDLYEKFCHFKKASTNARIEFYSEFI